MAKKGDQARESVKNIIIDAFASKNSFVAFQDKKIYVQVPDGPNGEVLQFAITMTMPKVPVVAIQTNDTAADWMNDPPEVSQTPVELTPEDEAKVQELMERLGAE